MNLEKKRDKRFFEEVEDVNEMMESIFLSYNVSYGKGEILMFIDEIQESQEAIFKLRYLFEEYPDLHVIAAGSLLDFTLDELRTFPVGRVEFLYIYPATFSEFLLATGADLAEEALNEIPPRNHLGDTLMNLFQTYTIIGGMPEVVAAYARDKSFNNLGRIYESIWETYKEDVAKYGKNPSERRIIRHIMDTAPHLADQRIKFHNFGNSNYRSREVGEAMRSLDKAGVVKVVYPSTDTQLPLRSDFKKSPRLQFLDTGLLNHALGLQARMIGLKDLSSTYRGAIVQHIVCQELMAVVGKDRIKLPNFWVREKSQSTAEVDLVIEVEDLIMPIEIKSGPTGRLKSLHQFVNRCNHDLAIRIYGGKFSVDEAVTPEGKPYRLMNLPYFMACKLPECAAWFVKKHG